METPQKLPSGNLRVRVKGPDGRRRSVTASGIRELKEAVKAKTAELYAPQPTVPNRHQSRRRGGKTRFDLFAEQWLDTRRPGEVGGYAPITYRRRLNHLVLLNEHFGKKNIEDVSIADVKRWWNARSAAPAHRSTLYVVLKMIMDVAVDDELIMRNPCRIRGASAGSGRKRPTFTDEDVQKIHDATDDAQMKSILLILMGTGLRIGELVALDWEQIELLDGRLAVTQHLTPVGMARGTKTGEEDTRVIALPKWVRQILEGLYAASDGEGAVFRNSLGRRLTVDLAEKKFRKIRATAGLDAMHLHDCRHVALTAYAQLPNVTLADVMAFGGHRSERVAMRYQHTTDDRAVMHAQASVAPRWVR